MSGGDVRAEAISVQVTGRGQDCHLSAVARYTRGTDELATLRFAISADRYHPAQGRGTVSCWTPAGWAMVHEIPGSLLAAVRASTDAATAADFAPDVAELQRVALRVLHNAAAPTTWFAAGPTGKRGGKS